jgi:hypothetical protein
LNCFGIGVGGISQCSEGKFLYGLCSFWKTMADEDIQPLVCDNGTGMVKVKLQYKDDSNIHNLFSEEVNCGPNNRIKRCCFILIFE